LIQRGFHLDCAWKQNVVFEMHMLPEIGLESAHSAIQCGVSGAGPLGRFKLIREALKLFDDAVGCVMLFVEVLAGTDVRRIYGVAGESLNGITDSVMVSKEMEWVGVRHEETAAFAAGAEAALTGKLAVCAGSCGPRQSASHQRALRLPSQPCACAGSCGANSNAGDWQRILSGDSSQALIQGVQPLLRTGFASLADATHS
jgi:hypothetical protein